MHELFDGCFAYGPRPRRTGKKGIAKLKLDMNNTYQSETGKLHSLFIKRVKDAFVDEEHVGKYWKELNYLGKPDLDRAISEYTSFESIFQSHGIKVFHLPADDNVNMDSIYCRDAAIATDHGMIICRMGKMARNAEPRAEQKAFEAHGIPILGIINAPGTLEGGDTAWLNERTLAVGHTYRTNKEGIEQLKQLLEPMGVDVLVVPLPHYRVHRTFFT